jgi:hypothetical protein
MTIILGAARGAPAQEPPAPPKASPASPPAEGAAKDAAADVFRPEAQGPTADAARKALEAVRAIVHFEWLKEQSDIAEKKKEDRTRALLMQIQTDVWASLEGKALLDKDEVRELVLAKGVRSKDGVSVLPLGRVVWRRRPELLPKGEPETVPLLVMLVAPAEAPAKPPKSFDVQGVWRDTGGKVLVRPKSPAAPRLASKSNGLFALVTPADAKSEAIGEFATFEFKLDLAKMRK